MAKDTSNNGHKAVTTSNTGKMESRIVELVVVDGKLVPDTSSPDNAVKR